MPNLRCLFQTYRQSLEDEGQAGHLVVGNAEVSQPPADGGNEVWEAGTGNGAPGAAAGGLEG